jgi:hypothetical protein
MKRIRSVTLLILILLLVIPTTAFAQTYLFSLDQMVVDVYWNEDGNVDILYALTFTNSPAADPIDFVDVGFPNSNYALSNVSASVNGNPITDIEYSPYVDNGVALGLGSNAIRPGQTGVVNVLVRGLERVLFQDDQDESYASAVFSTTYFDSDFVQGNTLVQVTFHLPPGVQPEEPRWHAAPAGFPDEPQTGFDDQGRITYTWINSDARGDQAYKFGASFPKSYVPESAVFQPTISDRVQIPADDLIGGLICIGFAIFFLAIFIVGIYSSRKRQLQYLPPKISIEGYGIKRGLTAIEAAILMEQPMDKILTMILFATIKKGAAEVVSKDPLELAITSPLPESLRPYEVSFLQAFTLKGKERRKALQGTMVDLVKSVSNKMKGFSRKDTLKYYQSITQKAWEQVEAAGTPEVTSEKFDEVFEWTMLDKDFDGRTREVFRDRPIFIPIWWGRYDPTYGRPTTARTSTGAPQPVTGGGLSRPTLPGADFAATVVTGIQDFSANVVGNITEFTGNITNKTNPVPKTSSGSSRSSGGGGCACACACAGCACACAGGGR